MNVNAPSQPGFTPVKPQELKATIGTPVPGAKDAPPPMVHRADVVAISLVSLLVITIVAVLYLAKAFFLPVIMAFIVGTMLAPAAGYLERHRIPRAISAVMIVLLACAGVAFMVGLIAAPVMDWSTRLPELSGVLKEKMRLLDRPLSLWHQIQTALGGSDKLPGSGFELPKIEWMQSAVGFLSPTFTESCYSRQRWSSSSRRGATCVARSS